MAREPRKGEVDGKDCRFVSSVEQMERDNLYGTSIKAVQEVANEIEVCPAEKHRGAVQTNLQKGMKIEQEFAEYFTAVAEGDSLEDIYNRAKDIIHEQSGNYIWVPSNEPL